LRVVALKYPFHYGAFPQTWENPGWVHPDTKAKGLLFIFQKKKKRT